ncbi:MAG TPA: alkaline phosphatase D family protein [Candidatus Limnocylindrales bacterium]|nr:alkaline phosphatase D family protein [Candidatus Limnocylindrales bacterium]
MTAGTFRHGVASGDPTTNRVVIWTRVSDAAGDAPVAVRWRLFEADGGRPAGHGQTLARPEADWTVSVDVGGLRPNTAYTYEFEVDGERSRTGRTRTLPDGDVGRTRFAQVSCAKYNAGHFNAYARLAERDDIAFVLHLGDWIYEASQNPPASQTPSKDIGRPFDPLHECRTLEDYRTRYAQYRLDPDVQAVAAAHPFIGTVDDHEFADGAWRDGATEHKEDRDGPWSERKAAAFRAREEWQPVRRPEPANPARVYRSARIGDLAEIFLLDTRTMRDEPVPPPALSRQGRTNLGPHQKAWLLSSLAGSDAHWRILGNPSVMARTWNDELPEHVRKALVKVKLIDSDGTGPDWDQWDGYPEERRELIRFIGELDPQNVVVLSGDVHVGLATELAEDHTMPPVAAEFVNTSLTSQNLDDKMGWAIRSESLAIERAILEGMPHMHYVDLDSHGYGLVDLDRERLRFEWWTTGLGPDDRGQVMSHAMQVRRGETRPEPVPETPPQATPESAAAV